MLRASRHRLALDLKGLYLRLRAADDNLTVHEKWVHRIMRQVPRAHFANIYSTTGRSNSERGTLYVRVRYAVDLKPLEPLPDGYIVTTDRRGAVCFEHVATGTKSYRKPGRLQVGGLDLSSTCAASALPLTYDERRDTSALQRLGRFSKRHVRIAIGGTEFKTQVRLSPLEPTQAGASPALLTSRLPHRSLISDVSAACLLVDCSPRRR